MKLIASLLTAVALLFAPPGFSGQADSSEANGTMVLPAEDIAAFSKQLETELAQHGARVAIVARAGRPISELPPGVRYTHVAFAVYSNIELQDGSRQPGYAIYNLYQQADKPDRSRLIQDYPFDFFAAVPELKAGVIIPTPALQQRLLQTITSDSYQSLHNPVYSLMANPHNDKTQNCTEFTLNVLQASIYQTDDIRYIKRTLSEHFTPQPIQINPLKMATGALLMPGLSLTDHPGPVRTTTFTSILAYLNKFDLVQHHLEL